MAGAADKSTALWVLKRLRQAGFEALLAGGCVRDMLLGVRSSDYDIATSATPEQVRRLFGRVLLVGARFGVAIVMRAGRQVEVATFRSDVSYSDGRRPDAVRFSDARQDALRRDFTINGMFFDPLAGRGGKLIDFVGGRQDLRKGLIRTIGSPGRRFSEDYLRMIRAVRFAGRLGFRIDPATARAVSKHAADIAGVSGERVFDELSKMLSHPSAPAAMRKLAELGLAQRILPELFAGDLWRWATGRLELTAGRAGRDAGLGLGAMLCELPEKAISSVTRRWGASNELRDELRYYSRHLGQWAAAESLPLCDFKRIMAGGWFARMRALWRAEEKLRTGGQVHARRIARRAGAVPPGSVWPAPLVTGDDLKALGLSEGPALGRLLRLVYDAQLNEEFSTRDQAMRLARQTMDSARASGQ